MKIIRAKDYDDMCRISAKIIASQVVLKPDSVLSLATGSTPVGIYKNLIEWNKNGDIDFSSIRTVNLDEYKGLPRENDQSYYYFMHHNLFSHININPDNTNLPDGMKGEDECERYDELIGSMGGVDIQLLGLGLNGHIGFNEPADYFPAKTHCVELTKSTIEANSRFFASMEEVPKYAYTMGIGTIMSARKVLMAVSGKAKAGIVKEMLYGKVTPNVPASILQFHPDALVVADEEALSMI